MPHAPNIPAVENNNEAAILQKADLEIFMVRKKINYETKFCLITKLVKIS